MLDNVKKYLIDDEPVTPEQLIDRARQGGYEADGFYTTSGSVQFLRRYGHVVTDNHSVQETPQ